MLTHALLADRAAAPDTGIGCVIWFLGLAAAGFGAYLHFFEEPGTIPNAVMITGGVVFVIGVIVHVLLAQAQPRPDQAFEMTCVGMREGRLVWGGAELSWDIEKTAGLPSGHYHVGNLEGRDLQEADAARSVVTIVIAGAEKSKHFEVKGVTLAEGDEVKLDAVGLGVMAIVGDDAYIAMTPTLLSPDVSAVEGMLRIDRAVEAFPVELTRRVLVVSPSSSGASLLDYALFGAVGGILLDKVDQWSDEKTRTKVAELVDRNLVRDAESGTSLLEFCRERGWELVIE
jgi:hypothetical protein